MSTLIKFIKKEAKSARKKETKTGMRPDWDAEHESMRKVRGSRTRTRTPIRAIEHSFQKACSIPKAFEGLTFMAEAAKAALHTLAPMKFGRTPVFKVMEHMRTRVLNRDEIILVHENGRYFRVWVVELIVFRNWGKGVGVGTQHQQRFIALWRAVSFAKRIARNKMADQGWSVFRTSGIFGGM